MCNMKIEIKKVESNTDKEYQEYSRVYDISKESERELVLETLFELQDDFYFEIHNISMNDTLVEEFEELEKAIMKRNSKRIKELESIKMGDYELTTTIL